MFKIDANSLYSLRELESALDELVSLPTFLDRLGLRDHRVFKDAIWGWEILVASRKAQSFSLRDHPAARFSPVINGPRGSRIPRRTDEPAGKLSIKDLQ